MSDDSRFAELGVATAYEAWGEGSMCYVVSYGNG